MKNDIKLWDVDQTNWVKAGMPEDDPNTPVPGLHPDLDHSWNVDRKLYIENLMAQQHTDNLVAS